MKKRKQKKPVNPELSFAKKELNDVLMGRKGGKMRDKRKRIKHVHRQDDGH